MKYFKTDPSRWCRLLLAGGVSAFLVMSTACRTTDPMPVPEPMAKPEVVRVPTPQQRRQIDSANVAASEGEYSVAVRLFEDLLDENPSLTLAYLELGNVYVDIGELEKAEPAFARAARLEPGNFDAQFGHGEVLQMLDKLVQAVRAYQRALAVKPDSVQVLVNMTGAYLRLDMPRSAMAAARRAVELAPEDGRARADLGTAYQQEGFFEDAIEQYEMALELLDTDPRVVRNLVECYSEANRFTEAANAGLVLVKIDPTPETWERLGRSHFRTGDYEASLDAYQQAVDLDPDFWPALNGIGVNKLNRWISGDRQDDEARNAAAEAFRASLRANPDQPKVVRLITTYGL